MAETRDPITRRKRPWVITFLAFLVTGGLIAMPFLAGPPDGEKMPDLVRFLGHFHPVLLHLPIGVFALILMQELGAMFFNRGKQRRETSVFPMLFGAASAVVAVLTGFLLYHGGGYEGNATAERHLWGGLAFAVAALATFTAKAWSVALAGNGAVFRLLLFGSVGVMGFASHDGASMTHGPDYLTVYAPDPVRKLLGLPPKQKPAPPKEAGDAVVYTDIIAPILENRCVQCHKESKAKGKLRMDTHEMLVKGGKEGPAFEAGNSAESNMIVRIELPLDDDEHMPPDGKPEVEAHELVVLKWWIDQGADPAKTLASMEVPAPVKDALALLSPSKPLETAEAKSPHEAPDAALVSTVATLSKDFPGALVFESSDSKAIAFSAVSLRGNLGDEQFAKFSEVIPHFITVDLSATKVGDKSVELLAGAKHLKLVRLAETGITDAAIETLLKLPALESINLYGTKVTDAGIAKFSALPGLKRLYLWQTAVTPEAIEALREKLPDCEIITGV